MSSEISGHVLLAEPMLAFHPERTAGRDIHPLRGSSASDRSRADSYLIQFALPRSRRRGKAAVSTAS